MAWYFTFMYKQPTRDMYVQVNVEDELEARKLMVAKYGDQWAFQYDEKEFQPQIERFGLTRLEVLS